MNILDRVLLYIAPRYAAKRELARFSVERIAEVRASKRKYEAASTTGRLSIWTPADTSANAETRGALVSLRQRARDLVRNNPWAAHAVEVISTLVVGDGIRPAINHLVKQAAKSKSKALDLWSDWADTTACDFDGERTMVELQSAVIDAVVTDGEVFIIRHKLTPSRTKEIATELGIEKIVPLQLQILEADFLDHDRNEIFKDGSKIIQGVEFNSLGQRVAYHFYLQHPGDTGIINFRTRETVRIPAERVRHVFRKDRLHQARGVTWFTRVMIRLHDLDIFEDATLQKQKIAACYAAFITGAADEEDDDEDTITLKEKLDSGTVEELGPGQDVKFSNPPSAADYPEFTKMQLRGVASGLGITYESLTQDLSSVNFSSGKMGQNGMNRRVRKWQKQIIVVQMMDPTFVWWREAADLITPGNMDMSQLWSQWTMPARELIDPVKEVSADKDAVESCFTTVSDVLRSRGLDPETVFQERAGELKRMKELGITVDSEPRGNAGSSAGAPNNDNPDQEGQDAEDKKNSGEDSASQS